MKRRDFIEKSCLACLVAGTGFSLLSLSSCTSTQIISTSSEKGLLKVDKASFKAESKAVIIRTKELEYDVLLLKSDAGYKAFYLQCSHQNNPVNYNSSGIVCNTHGSRFDLNGTPTVGPADKPLKSFITTIENDSISIKIN